MMQLMVTYVDVLRVTEGDVCQIEPTRKPGNQDNVSGNKDSSSDGIPSYIWIVVGIGIALIVVILLAVFVFLVKRRGHYELETGATSVSQVNNPLYGHLNKDGKSDNLLGQPDTATVQADLVSSDKHSALLLDGESASTETA